MKRREAVGNVSCDPIRVKGKQRIEDIQNSHDGRAKMAGLRCKTRVVYDFANLKGEIRSRMRESGERHRIFLR